jgi:hypothetical protein
MFFARAARAAAPLLRGAGKTQQQHPPPNNEELGPGICPNLQIHQNIYPKYLAY